MALTPTKVRKSLYNEPFRPELLQFTPHLSVTDEQWHYIKNVLDISCSDSRFAEKAYDAIRYILNPESAEPKKEREIDKEKEREAEERRKKELREEELKKKEKDEGMGKVS